MTVVEGIVTFFTIASILFFVVYLAGLTRLPTGHRPTTPIYNRFGEKIGETENPGYEETEEEHHP